MSAIAYGACAPRRLRWAPRVVGAECRVPPVGPGTGTVRIRGVAVLRFLHPQRFRAHGNDSLAGRWPFGGPVARWPGGSPGSVAGLARLTR